MKNFTLLFKIACLFFLSVLTFSCSGDELKNSDLYEGEIPQKISDFISSDDSYSIFNDALANCNIQGLISDQENITVFAPSNIAFQSYLQENGYDTVEDIPLDYLEELLKNHIMIQEITLGDLESSSELILETMAQTHFESSSPVMSIVSNNNGLKVNGFTINTPDMFFVNGVVHSVDQVVELSTVNTFINESIQFSEFNNLIEQSENAAVITSTLEMGMSSNSLNELTIFAPDNAAVEHFKANMVTTNSTDSVNQLINYAVSTQVATQDNLEVDELTNGLSIQTLGATVSTMISNGDEISFRTSPFSEIVNLKSGINSIQTSNGILLLTDKVLF